MPTNAKTKAASLAKRHRVCVICAKEFYVPSADRIGRTCSKPCGSKYIAKCRTGHKQSEATLAKRAAAMRLVRQDPAYKERWNKAAAAGIAAWHSKPENAAAFAARMSARMKKRHADPEWQKVRNSRSSRVMKANWEKHGDKFRAQSIERYIRHSEAGTGICSEDSKGRKAVAAKWILKRAQEALHTETDYDATYAAVQARLRTEMPYDGPQEGSDYYEYLQKLGSAVVNSQECRSIADTFMSGAIPKFAEQWQKRKDDPPNPPERDPGVIRSK